MKFKKFNLTNAYQKVWYWLQRGKISIYPSVANTWTLSLALSATPWTDDIISLGNWQWLVLDSDWNNNNVYAKSSLASGDILYIVEN